jgi:hypothetical protein
MEADGRDVRPEFINNLDRRSGYEIHNICTERDQPAPAPGWAPINADFDFYVQDASAWLDNIVTYNTTRGVAFTKGTFLVSGPGERSFRWRCAQTIRREER